MIENIKYTNQVSLNIMSEINCVVAIEAEICRETLEASLETMKTNKS